MGLGNESEFAAECCEIRFRSGYTFIELLVVATIVLILASAIMPLAKVTGARARAKPNCTASLREMRTAIDKYKDAADLGQIGSLDIKVGSENYPPDLQTLVDGVTAANDATGASSSSCGAFRSIR